MLKDDIEELSQTKFIDFFLVEENESMRIYINSEDFYEYKNAGMALFLGGDDNLIFNLFSSLIISKQDCIKLANFILDKYKENI